MSTRGPRRRLSDEAERRLTQEYAGGATTSDLARAYGVGTSSIANIVRRRGGTVRQPGRQRAADEPDELTGGRWVPKGGIVVYRRPA